MKKLIHFLQFAFFSAAAQVCYQPHFEIPAGTTPKALINGDFNEDGYEDLAVANFGSDNVSILIGQPGGTFSHTSDYATGNAPHHVITADFNYDGHLDLATANYYSSGISVLLGNGNGTFRVSKNFDAGGMQTALVTADFDGDNILDIGASCCYLDSVVLLKGSGNGTFTKLKSWCAPGCSALCTADLNGDGLNDLATCNGCYASVSVLLSNGSGNFLPRVNYSLGSYYEHTSITIMATDLNSDAFFDLVTCDQGDISVLLDGGSGTFNTPVSYFAGNCATTAVASDLDGDGHVDIATANFAADVSLLKGNGSGAFPSVNHLSAGNGPRGLTSADFNKDGWPDLATANNNSNDVSIILSCKTMSVASTIEHQLQLTFESENTLHAQTDQPGTLHIFSMLGDRVYRKEVADDERVQLDFLSSGTYLAILETSTGTIKRKLVKQ